MYDDLAAVVDAGFARTKQELEDLVRIPSISAPDFDPAEVRRCAEAAAALLAGAGFAGIRLLEVEGAHPAVYGEVQGPPGSPTVLLYAHHDVQPPGPVEAWESDPFAPVERDGRLYGRGTADDKAGIVVHAAALRALGGEVPVGLKVFVEGEEEIGSVHVDAFFERFGDLLSTDVIVIADCANWMPGVPTLTTSLRGLVDCTIEVATLDDAVHSGLFGGALPDALMVLARVLASLHDEEGNVAVAGLAAGEADDPANTEDLIRMQASVVDGVEFIGSGSVASRMWHKPAISILAVDAPPISDAINQLVPSARAKISMRIAPGESPTRAMRALTEHLEAAAPWGARITVTPGATANPFAADTSGPATAAFTEAMRQAYDADVIEVGVGGSIPIVSAFAESYPDAGIVLGGAADSLSQMHGPNESVGMEDLRRTVLSEAIALRLLAESA